MALITEERDDMLGPNAKRIRLTTSEIETSEIETSEIETSEIETSKIETPEKFETSEIEQLPNEILLKILTYLDVINILKSGQICKRIREITRNTALWQKTILFKKIVSFEFVKFVLDSGCKYLSLRYSKFRDWGDSELTKNYQLKHLDLTECVTNRISDGPFIDLGEIDVNIRKLLNSCNSLQKLALPTIKANKYNPDATLNIFKEVFLKNGKTLQVLHMGYQIWSSRLRSEMAFLIVKNLKELREIQLLLPNDASTGDIDFFVNNLTPKIEKFCLEDSTLDRRRFEGGGFEDKHLQVLLNRCNNIKELDLSRTSITDNSVPKMVKYLKNTLEKLDISNTGISVDKLIEFRAMSRLSVLNIGCKPGQADSIENLRTQISDIKLNLVDFNIAYPWIADPWIAYPWKSVGHGPTEGMISDKKKHCFKIITENKGRFGTCYFKYLW